MSLSLSKISRVEIPLPEIEQQREMIRKVEEIENEIIQTEKRRAELEEAREKELKKFGLEFFSQLSLSDTEVEANSKVNPSLLHDFAV